MIKRLSLRGCNAYLIDFEGKSYLIDTGIPGNLKRVREMEQIDGIILTHGHYDHAGSAVEISDYFSCKVYAHKDEHPYLEGLDEFLFNGVVGKIAKRLERLKPMAHFKPSDLKDLDISFMHFPGHTPGSIGVIIENSIICGDLVRVRRKHLIAGRYEIKPSSRNFNWNQKAYIKSLERLAETKVSKVYPGHGESVTLDKEVLKRIVDRLRE